MSMQVRIEAINALQLHRVVEPDQNPRNATFGIVNQDRNNPRGPSSSEQGYLLIC